MEISYKMELLNLSDDMLDEIFLWIKPWWWGQWYDLIRVCKRFHKVLRQYRQGVLEDFICWEEPQALNITCSECDGSLTDKSLALFNMGHNDYTDNIELFCSVTCSEPWFPYGHCIHCDKFTIRIYSDEDEDAKETQFECLDCNPHALDRAIVGKRFKPLTIEGHIELHARLFRGERSDKCEMCGKTALSSMACIYFKDEAGKFVTKMVCGYLCHLKCITTTPLRYHSVNRPSSMMLYPTFK